MSQRQTEPLGKHNMIEKDGGVYHLQNGIQVSEFSILGLNPNGKRTMLSFAATPTGFKQMQRLKLIDARYFVRLVNKEIFPITLKG